ncbi:MAG: tetratricopeptide repeat protein [Planctomycetia bacterium]|nr:tetratricopeptide repeat protein [Planctomycetia bacterium]
MISLSFFLLLCCGNWTNSFGQYGGSGGRFRIFGGARLQDDRIVQPQPSAPGESGAVLRGNIGVESSSYPDYLPSQSSSRSRQTRVNPETLTRESQRAGSGAPSVSSSRDTRQKSKDSGAVAVSGVTTPASVVRENPNRAQEKVGKSKLASGSVGALARRNGRVDFLRVIKREDLPKLREPENVLYVVAPRSAFQSSGEELENVPENQGDSVAALAPLPDLVDANQEEVFQTVDVTQAVSLNIAYADGADSRSDANSDSQPQEEEFIVFILSDLDVNEKALLKDALNGQWDQVDLLNAALIAEGLATKESRAHYQSRFDNLYSVLAVQLRGLNEPLQKTEKVYGFLHDVALYSRYDLNCSSVAASLDSGVFNCVSATVLFNCFASRAGLKVAALETTGHAKSRVKFDTCYLDIETTCSKWSNLPDQIHSYPSVTEKTESTSELSESPTSEPAAQERSDSALDFAFSEQELNNSPQSDSVNSDVTRFLDGFTTFTVDSDAPMGYSFTRSRRPMREISDVELIATIYYNVGVDYYQAGDFESAIASYIKAVQLAPNNRTILGNLKATLNNWAIDVAMRYKDYEQAIRITQLGRCLDPDFREFNQNLPIFFNDWIEYLAKDDKWDEIEHIQNEYKKITKK